jgi:tryptophanyl-tRNA synthetase
MARDIAQRFNHIYGDTFTLPEAVIDEKTAVLSGLDGRKMSKSYNNTIPLFSPSKKLRKLIMKIKTNSLEPGEPKETEGSTLFDIYRAVSTPEETKAMQQKFADGIGWGDAKQELFEYLDAHLGDARLEYESLLDAPDHVESVLRLGAQRAREVATLFMQRVRAAVGIDALG